MMVYNIFAFVRLTTTWLDQMQADNADSHCR